MSEKDTIYRQDAIDALRDARHRFTVADEAGGFGTVKWSEDVIYFAAAERVLSDLPSAQPKTGRDCTDFVRWLMDEVMDEENWQMNAVANGEIICRKLKKLGILDVVDGYYIKTQETGDMKGW